MPNITITHAITYTKTGTTWSFALSGSKNQLSMMDNGHWKIESGWATDKV